MPAPRYLRRRPAQLQRPPYTPLPGYLCEVCQDAPAVQWEPVPEGGEMGVCTTCLLGRDADDDS